jgi:hypothetical protein
MKTSEISTLSYYALMILGLIFEIIGALFVSMESIGLMNFRKTYNFIYSFSSWTKKSWFRMSVVVIPILLPLFFFIIYNYKIFLALYLPFFILMLLFTTLIDHPKRIEDYVINKTNEKKIGPIGFLIMIIGFLLQLSGNIWQLLVTVH